MKNITQKSSSRIKILAFVIALFAFAGVQAHSGSSLRLQLPPHGEHTIFINNTPYNGVYDRFKIDNLRAGNYRIKVMELIISPRGRVVGRQIIYNGFVFVPASAKVWARVSQNGRLFIERTMFNDYNNRRYEDHCGSQGGYNRYDQNRGNSGYDYDDDHYKGSGSRDDYFDEDWYGYYNDGSDDNQYGSNDDRYDNQYNRGNDRGYDRGGSRNDNRNNSGYNNGGGNGGYSVSLTINAIKNQSFDTERLKIAKNAVMQNRLNSSEIAEITKLFSFESSRLDFAKYAYDYVIDPKNYVIVQDAFMFSSSTSELQDYIAAKGRR